MPPTSPPDFNARMLDAAVEAERETGTREETLDKARAHVVIRLFRMGTGSALLGLGVVMLPLPGPGWLVIALGLGVLARDVAWAERALERVRRRLPTDGAGKISRASVATMIVAALASTAAAIWWLAR